ncbi:MAG: PKD domain-containing protein [Flavisolibacter sp.]
MVLASLLCWLQGFSQALIREVRLIKIDSSLYKVEYRLDNRSYDIKEVTLKVIRKRDGKVEEIFSAPVEPKIKPGNQSYTCYWKTGASTLKEGDELQARISVNYKKLPGLVTTSRKGTNLPPKADAGPFMSVHLPAEKPIVLDGSKSYDPDGKIVSAQWKQIGGPSTLRLSAPDSLSTKVEGELMPGNYAFELTVKDERGSTSSDRLALNIEAATEMQLVTTPPAQKKKDSVAVAKPAPVFKTAAKLKGGPSNAIFNILVPGLGHYGVSGGPYGRNRKPALFAITAVYAGAVGGAFYYRSRSEQEYQNYQDMAQYREFQRDASGNIIGVRGASQSEANIHLHNAESFRRNALILGGAAVTILGADLVYTLVKGIKNKKQWQKETGGVSQLFIQSNGNQLAAGVRIKL